MTVSSKEMSEATQEEVDEAIEEVEEETGCHGEIIVADPLD